MSFDECVCKSYGVDSSFGVFDSSAVNLSFGVYGSKAVYNCFAVLNCNCVSFSLFCCDLSCHSKELFNKPASMIRLVEVHDKLLSFHWFPRYKTGKDAVGNKEAWRSMPSEMLEYIKSLPEYDEEIFNKITGDLDETEDT